jgi:hypothetical protein
LKSCGKSSRVKDEPAIADSVIPRAALPTFQDALDIYASETNGALT